MIDFTKKIHNSNKFRQAAIHFQRYGYYTSAPKGTTEYIKYWEEEQKRSIDGYTAPDGDWCSGYNYFYLNFCPIQRIVETETIDRFGNNVIRKVKTREFADFYDYDYYFFCAVDEAEHENKHMVVLKSRRKGYEQPYSENVLTPDGFKQMGELHVGDKVMNPNGSPCTILEIVEQGLQDVYEVELQDGRKIRCGKNHLWATINATRGKIHIMRTVDYMNRKLVQGSKNKEYYPYKVPEINPLHFNFTSIDIDPYVLGVLLGDGHICGSQIIFSSDDAFIVEEMQRRLPDYIVKPRTSCPFQYVIIATKKEHSLGRLLKKYNLRVKANNKFIPFNFKHASIEDRFELVRGLMDTDGSCSKGACTFTNTSEQLIDDLVYVLRSLGIRCKKSKKIEGRLNVDFGNGNFSNTLPHWELCITTQEPIFKLPRKLEKIRNDRAYNFNGVGLKSIKKLDYKEQQRCIVVDNENSLYVTTDFVATHNSFKCGSMLDRNYYLIPESKSYAMAGENEFLIKDGILTKAWEYMDFIDEHTAWGKKRQVANRQMHRRASYITTDNTGNKIEGGYKSEVMGVTLKNDPQKARGKAGKLILFEEAGKLPNLLTAWTIAKSSVEQDGFAYGLMIAFGTGGTVGADFDGLKELFYNCDAYGIKVFDNIWEEGAYGNTCGFFVPEYANLNNTLADGTKLMDKDGNTNSKAAIEFTHSRRKPVIDNAKDKNAIDRYVAEHPLTPSEACLQVSGNIFPKKDLTTHLANIRNNKKTQGFKQIGSIDWNSGELKWSPMKIGNITKFPIGKDDDPTGAIVIWEHPVKDAPHGLYIAGCDPYDHDKSGTNSLGSTFIYKRIQTFEDYYDLPVAEYTGRPNTAEEYYENVRKLLIYYNARLLYENERKGLFVYFTQKHSEYLLLDQPNELIRDIIGDTKVQRNKGIHMNKFIKDYMEGLIKEWLLEEYAPGKLNLTKILSEPLLEELISYNDTGNFDRVIAFGMVMLYRQQLHNIKVKEVKDGERKRRQLFETPLFMSNDMLEQQKNNYLFS